MSQLTLAFDTETGGLNPKKEDLLTAYFCILDQDFKLIDEIYLKLKPDNGRLPIANPGALKVNKIDLKKHLEDPETITYSEANKKLIAFLKKHHKKSGRFNNLRPLGHNIQFDIDYCQEYIISRDEWDSLIHYAKVDSKGIVDFLKDCQWLPPELGKLETVARHFGIPIREAHNAREDTLMCVEAYKKIVEMVKAKKDSSRSEDLISLLESE